MSKVLRMKSLPKAGEIPYYRCIADENGTYSIDRFTFNFRVDDLFYKLLELELLRPEWRAVEHFAAHRFSDKVEVYQYLGLHIEMWRGRPSSLTGDICNCIKLDFNPNKCGDNPLLSKIFKAIREKATFTVDLSRVDYAFDIPLPLSDVYVLSRKSEGNFGTTRYYGKPGSNGHMRVYDKRMELLQKGNIEIGREVTRLEWEQRGGKDLKFTFDRFCVADFSGLQFPASVIPYIQPENINSAFRSMHYNTRPKYKKLFTPYPFYPERFLSLLDAYAEEYGVLDNRWSYTEWGTAKAVAERSESVSVALLSPSQVTLSE